MSKITIDPDQIFTKNINLNLIDKYINYSKNKYIKKFIENNKHLELNENEKKEYIVNLKEKKNINFTCNKIIKLYTIEEIKNNSYFRGVLSSCDDDKIINFLINNNIQFELPKLCLNSNEKAVDYIFNNILEQNPIPMVINHFQENKEYISKDLLNLLSENENNRIVDYLIKNPDKININGFLVNNNPKAIQYCYNKY